MADELAWMVVAYVVGLAITLCQVQRFLQHRNLSPLRDWIPWVGRPARSPWRDWLVWFWVFRVVGDQAASIPLVILTNTRNELNFGAWACTTTILFVMLEEAFRLYQALHKLWSTPSVVTIAILLLAVISGLAFVLSGQCFHRGTLSTILVVVGCDIFTVLHSVALLAIFIGTQGERPWFEICRFLLTRCVIVVGNLFVFLSDEWFWQMLILVTALEVARLIDVIWHYYPKLIDIIRHYFSSDESPQGTKHLSQSHDGGTASSEEHLIIDDFSKHGTIVTAPQATLTRMEYDDTSFQTRGDGHNHYSVHTEATVSDREHQQPLSRWSSVNYFSVMTILHYLIFSALFLVPMPLGFLKKQRSPTLKAWKALGYILLPNDFPCGRWACHTFADGTQVHMFYRTFLRRDLPRDGRTPNATYIEIETFNTELNKHKGSDESRDISLNILPDGKRWLKWCISYKDRHKLFQIRVNPKYKPESGQTMEYGIGGNEAGGGPFEVASGYDDLSGS